MAKVTTPIVSVIVPTWNEEKNIGRLLKSVGEQHVGNVESIVVDDGSTDSTVAIARSYGVKVFPREHKERSTQRNFGASMSRGRFLLFLDADMELSPNVLSECLKLFKDNRRLDAVIIPEESRALTFWEKVKAFERSFYNIAGDKVTDAARFFPKKVFNAVGGYDESITGPEDWDLPEVLSRKGYEIGRIKAKIFHYEKIKGLSSLLRKKFYYGLKLHRYLKKNKIALISPKTVYFLRPVFYKNWKKILAHPFLSLAMLMMLFAEMVAGGLGFVVGKMKNI